MAVLSIARSGQPKEFEIQNGDPNTQGGEDDESIDAADSISRFSEQILNALSPTEKYISVSWQRLSPILSVFGSIATVAYAVLRWAPWL